MDLSVVSRSLDVLKAAHAGLSSRDFRGAGVRCHSSPPEVEAFGATFGLNCGWTWGYTCANWDIMADLVGDWVSVSMDKADDDRRALLNYCDPYGDDDDHDETVPEEPYTLLIFGKTFGSFCWELAAVETVRERESKRPRSRNMKTYQKEVRNRMVRQLKAHMVNPSRRDVVNAHSALEWPCATMCTIYHQRFPSFLRPRLLVFLYSDKWMVFDKYGLTDRTRWQRSVSRGRTLGAHVELSVSLFPGLTEPSIWRNGSEPQQAEPMEESHRRQRAILGLVMAQYRDDPHHFLRQAELIQPAPPREESDAQSSSPEEERTVASSTDLNAEANIGFLDDETEARLLKEANLRKYEEWNQKREEARGRLEAEMERPLEFKIGHSLRLTWVGGQAKDPDCVRILRTLDGQRQPTKSKNQQIASRITEEYRRAEDGLLERKVATTDLGQPGWVPVVPVGYASGMHTWKRWTFLQLHIGVFGAHRNAEKTTACMRRVC